MPKTAKGTDGSALLAGLNTSGLPQALKVDGSGNLQVSSSGGVGASVSIADPNTPANKLTVNADGSINVNPSSSSASQAINDGSVTTRKATVDASGNLHTLESNSATLVTNTGNTASFASTTATNTGTTATGIGAPGDAAYTSGSGSIIAILKGIFGRLALGQQTKSASLPVTIASDQGNFSNNIAQWNGSTPGTGNPVYTSNALASGYVAAFGSNPTALTANADYQFKWGAGGSTQVNHMMIQNNSAANVQWDLDTSTSAGSPVLAPNQTIFLDVQTTVLHLLSTGTPNVNGSSGSNVVVRAWL